MPLSAPLPAGTNLDGYEILGPLGSGGMGEVYRARDPILKREVAIKVLPSSVATDADRLRRFEQEAQAAAALNHPNILAVYRFGVFAGAPYLVAELLVGETLRAVQERGPLAARKAIDMGVQIAHGLAAAHEKGIVHRDLKPENLFLTKDGRVKILDFGLAKLTQPQVEPGGFAPTMTHATEPGVVMGTAGYMAPEQVRGLAAGHRADIFAFGAILYELLAGKRAFHRSTAADTMAAILNEDPPAISQMAMSTPPGLQRVVQRCLEKNPEQRFQSAADLAFALEALSDSAISASGSASGWASVAAATPVRKPRRWVTAVSACMVMLALVVGIFFYMRQTFHRARHVLPPAHKQVTFLGNAYMPAISPDGRSVVYVTRPVGKEQVLMVQDLAGGPGLELAHAEFLSNPSWSPDGSGVSVSRYSRTGERGRVVVSRLGGPARLIGNGGYSCWLPTPGQILLANQNPEAGVRLLNLLTGESKQLPTPRYSWLMDLACAAKSGRILLLTLDADKDHIWSMQSDGTDQRREVDGDAGTALLSPRWAPNNESFYYFRRKAGTTDLMKCSLKSSRTTSRVLVDGLETGDFFTISPDGSQLAYTRLQTSSNLWSISLPASTGRANGQPLTSGTLLYEDPMVSPDGRSVVFSMGSGSGSNIYKMPVEGGQPLQLTSLNDTITRSPAWSPDGLRIAFIADQGGDTKVWLVPSSGGNAQTLKAVDASNSNFALAWAPNPQLFMPVPELHNLRRIDVETQKQDQLFPRDSDGWLLDKPRYSPDGKIMAVLWNRESHREGTYLVDMETLSVSLGALGISAIGWSPDGKSIYGFIPPEGLELLQATLGEAKPPKSLIALPGLISAGTVTPDGHTAVVSVGEERSDVWLLKDFDPDAADIQ